MRAVFRMLLESRAAASSQVDLSTIPCGVDQLRPSLELAIEFSRAQGLLTAPLAAADLVDEVTATLIDVIPSLSPSGSIPPSPRRRQPHR